jgi:hypothetical protein
MKEEKGALIVEASFVFPIMFFVLLILIYMGNMFYMRSRVDALVTKAAVNAAACCADPFLAKVEDGTVPTTIDDVKPYHSLLGGSEQAKSVREELDKSLRKLGSGFFSGMNLKSQTIDQFEYKKGLLTSSFTVSVSYGITFPIRFIGSDEPITLKINSYTTVPVTDTPEFILNVDMAMDFSDASGLSEKLNKMVSQVKQFLGN